MTQDIMKATKINLLILLRVMGNNVNNRIVGAINDIDKQRRSNMNDVRPHTI